MQIDPNQSLELQLLVSIPVKQVELNIGAEKRRFIVNQRAANGRGRI